MKAFRFDKQILDQIVENVIYIYTLAISWFWFSRFKGQSEAKHVLGLGVFTSLFCLFDFVCLGPGFITGTLSMEKALVQPCEGL